MRLVYFASVREQIGLASEEVEVPAGVGTVAELVGWLGRRGEGYAEAFADPRVVRAAIDRRHVRPETPVAGAGEIAFFPPMTGG